MTLNNTSKTISATKNLYSAIVLGKYGMYQLAACCWSW